MKQFILTKWYNLLNRIGRQRAEKIGDILSSVFLGICGLILLAFILVIAYSASIFGLALGELMKKGLQ